MDDTVHLPTFGQTWREGDNQGEMIKWFGIIILATHFEFADRASLWSNVYQSKYRSASDFGKTSMNRHRFDMLWRHVRWSHHLDVRGEGTSHEDHRWKLVEDFVTHFNEYCTQLFSPSDLICADESILQWYGQGGHWINLGLKMYAAMDRKAESGAEIQNSA